MKFISKLNLLSNIELILRESYNSRHTDLDNCKEVQIKYKYFSKFNFIILIVALSSSVLFFQIEDALVNAILTYTTIYATLIIPVLIIIYDKFSNDPNKDLSEVQKKSDGALKRICLYKNFTKRFIFVTLESILISILLILMILVYKAMPTYSLSLNYSDFSFSFAKDSIIFFISCIFPILIIKTIFAFFLVKLIYYNFFTIGALGDFFNSALSDKSTN